MKCKKVILAIPFIAVLAIYLYTFFLLWSPPTPPPLFLAFMTLIYFGGILGLWYWLREIIGRGRYKILDWPWKLGE